MKKISRIEISFQVEVALPDGFDRALEALVYMVCDQYQREHPTEVMWPAGHGSKMLSNPYMLGDDEPMEFDDSVYAIDVYCREDYYGENRHNPEQDRLRQEAIAARKRDNT